MCVAPMYDTLHAWRASVAWQSVGVRCVNDGDSENSFVVLVKFYADHVRVKLDSQALTSAMQRSSHTSAHGKTDDRYPDMI